MTLVSPWKEALGAELLPGANLSDEDLKVQIKQNILTWNQYTGTCALGEPNNPQAVVDTSLRVKGIKDLRVADLSILTHPGIGNAETSAIMIGEKAADIILYERKL